MDVIIALLGAASFLLVFAAVTMPKAVARPQQERSRQYRLKELDGLGIVAGPVESLAAWLRGEETEGQLGGNNTRYVQLLKQADWYWAPGEAQPPSPDARFWNLSTLWAAKVFTAALFGLGGLVLAGAAAAVFRWSPAIALVGLLGGVAGFFDPDSELKEAAEHRSQQIVLEMGYKVPELRVYVRSGRTFVSALRYLTDRPGGPFVKELHRILEIYDITADLERGLLAVVDRNPLCEPLANFCADLMAVVAEGGELGPVLEAHTDTAQHEQRRYLRQQGQDNTQQMTYVVSGTTLVTIFLLVGSPALWIVLTSLGGM
jgi:Flp pilus assembly protein TadB